MALLIFIEQQHDLRPSCEISFEMLFFLFCFFKLHFHLDSFSASIKSIIYKLLWIVGQLVSSAVFIVLTSDCFAAIFLTR